MDYERQLNLSIGSVTLSNRFDVQFNAPEIGGMLLEMGDLSSTLSTRAFPSMKRVATTLRSCL
jgi:hypothetical protein